MTIPESDVVLCMLLFARVSALLVAAPLFGHQSIPVQFKVAIGIFCTFILYHTQQPLYPHLALVPAVIILTVLKEAATGLLIGFSVNLLFYGVRYAGEIITFEMGISIANAFDPESNTSTPVMGEFLHLFTLLLFLILNGHHFVLQALVQSYSAVPLGAIEAGNDLARHLITMTGRTLIVAVKFAAPVLVTSFLANIALAIMSRVMPQGNVFGVSFPLKIILALTVLISTVPLMAYLFRKLLTDFEGQVTDLLRMM